MFDTPNADHIKAAEAKEDAERLAKREQTDRVTLIGLLQRTIADAERRKAAPIFASESAAETFQWMSNHVEDLSTNYQNRLWQARHSAIGCHLELSSEEATAYFFKEIIIGKMPALVDKMNSRDGRGDGLCEAKRAAVVAECDRTISDAKAKLSALGV